MVNTPVVESSPVWDFGYFSLESDHCCSSSHPNIVVFDYSKQLISFIEVLCPADIIVQLIVRHRDQGN